MSTYDRHIPDYELEQDYRESCERRWHLEEERADDYCDLIEKDA